MKDRWGIGFTCVCQPVKLVYTLVWPPRGSDLLLLYIFVSLGELQSAGIKWKHRWWRSNAKYVSCPATFFFWNLYNNVNPTCLKGYFVCCKEGDKVQHFETTHWKWIFHRAIVNFNIEVAVLCTLMLFKWLWKICFSCVGLRIHIFLSIRKLY